ncbi:MAG TPA: peptidylprolyl isomerase [Chloroflexia bacterium]|nr:peptidylprolyl isomerase [Chloroflexia bacterium]
MAKKKKLQSTAPVPTRGQLSRAAQEQQKIRNLYTAGIAIGALVVLVLGFAAAFTYVIQPNQEVAKVNDTSINRATYNKLRRWNLYQQLQQDAFTAQLGAQSGSAADTTTITSDQAALKGVDKETQLDPTTIQTLVDNEVLRQASTKDYSLNPTKDELMAEAVTDFVPQPTAPPASQTPTAEISATEAVSMTATATPTGTQTPTSTSTPTITPTRGSPTDTPTETATFPPVPGASETAVASFNSFLDSMKLNVTSQGPYCSYGCPDLSQDDYMAIVIEPRLRQKQVTDKLITGVITDVAQVRIQEIITTTQDGANALLAQLDGGADFADVAGTQANSAFATDGLVDWFAQDNSGMDQAVVDAAFATDVDKYSQVVTATSGQFYIIKVLQRDDHRPMSSTQLDAKKQQLYNDWFTQAKTASTIAPSTFQAPTPTAPPLVPPTNPPSNNTATPTTVTGGTPPASGTSTGSTSDTTPVADLTATAPTTKASPTP